MDSITHSIIAVGTIFLAFEAGRFLMRRELETEAHQFFKFLRFLDHRKSKQVYEDIENHNMEMWKEIEETELEDKIKLKQQEFDFGDDDGNR